ncbi:MAG: aspartoacylase [Leptolyngbya sp. UWPOB_LEPTO1]|uniref:aspartoacylase n=1 Tax=Leptolyngbya sp. UWPOB_LEPTO1 TaxID=2815653 RepID=UPI001AC76A2C|nr:aspartoacylase [Leptolyngbya sp. UWPOB_LEPTO1]MBN8561634.1 aspartoacylase [Leptolyngbya sp. UWPOB_LEPTO1]
MSKLIRRVAIVGGTHGNEWTGVYLVKKLQQFPALTTRSSFETITLLANPKAIELNRRYIDQDLNRSFASEDLLNPKLINYENQRARDIVAQLGSRDQPQVDVIIDLHSTTSNMGLTILPSTPDPFNLRLSAYLSQIYPDVRVALGMNCTQDAPLLRSLSPLGFTIEVGAVAQSVLNADLFLKTEQLIYAVLDYIEALNQGKPLDVPPRLTLYQAIEAIDYPRDAIGNLQAFIHPDRQFKDYEPLQPDEPIFLTFAGESICYQGNSTVFPIFINEAAYYEKQIAMILTEKREIELDKEY